MSVMATDTVTLARVTDGSDGLGVSAVVEQYYLSTSSTAQAGGSWGTDQPAWSDGRYIWTRSQVTWSDGTVTITDPVLARAVNGANELANQASVTAAGAASTAGQALDAANATSQFFWSDSGGAHVSTQPGDAAGTSNVLINALGILLRAAQNNLLSITPSGVTIYDGKGNADANVVGTFTATGVELGRNSQTASIDMCKGNLSVTSRRAGISDYGIVYGKNVTIMASGEGTSGAVLSVGGTPEELSDMALGILQDSGDGKGPTVFSQSQVIDARAKTVKLSDVSPNGASVTVPMSRFLTAIQPVVLYNGGATDNITLPESTANFSDIRIYYNANGQCRGSVDVHSPDGKDFVQLHGMFQATDTIAQYRFRALHIHGTHIDTQSSGYVNFDTSGSFNLQFGDNRVIIERIIGWR